jgi:hypothetical protein
MIAGLCTCHNRFLSQQIKDQKMLKETNRTIYLKITLTEEQTDNYRDTSDEDFLTDMYSKPISDFNYQVIYNVTHES